MKNILIVYIATGDYNYQAPGFFKSLEKFCPDSNKYVHVWTDNLDCYKGKEIAEGQIAEVGKNSDIVGVSYFPNLMWPCTVEHKFALIMSAAELYKNIDYIFYFNSNIEFRDTVEDNVVLNDKIIAVPNYAWDHFNHNPLKHTYNKPLDKNLACYIEVPYVYLQSDVMGGPTELYLKFAKKCNELTAYDLAHNRIPPFHDESYWNSVCHANASSVMVLDLDYNMYEEVMEEYGHPNAKIILRNSDKTQYELKDKYHENQDQLKDQKI